MQNTKRTHRRRRRILLPLLMAGSALIAATGATLSLALFTDSASASANSFTTGTIHIGVAPTTAVLSAPAMMPGDVVNGSLVVSNTGTAQLRYAISGSATNSDIKGLASQINIQIKTADTAGGTTCTSFSGSSLFNGTVPYAEGPLLGNYAVHPNGGRSLDAGTGETLCFRATLPSATPNGYEGATTTMTFTFYAEQTANN